jgi:hypothetical protein
MVSGSYVHWFRISEFLLVTDQLADFRSNDPGCFAPVAFCWPVRPKVRASHSFRN